jgi:hypothetical protein
MDLLAWLLPISTCLDTNIMFVDRLAEPSEVTASYNDHGSDADLDLTTWCVAG